MKLSIQVLTLLAVFACPAWAANYDLYFDFSGYRNVAKLLVRGCNPDVRSQINQVLAGKATTNAIDMPTTNPTLPRVSCWSDPLMGTVPKFFIYRDDNDPVTRDPEQQRIEMKVFEPSPSHLKATKNSNFIYSWWFKLDPSTKVSNEFFHIFQLKAIGNKVDDFPLATFTMTIKDGLHLRLRDDDRRTVRHYKLASMSSVLGKWIQAFVQVNYKTGKTPGASNSGSIRILLKDESGRAVFPSSSLIQTPNTFYGNMFWKEASFVRPKWGLYRKKSPLHQAVDWQLFQNVQIWKK